MKKLLPLAFALSLAAWPAQAYVPPVLQVGFTPWENPQDMAKSAGPISEILAKATHMKVQAFLSTDYSGVVEAMRSGKVDVAFFPPGAYVLAEKQAHAKVILKSMFGGKALYYSAIIALKKRGFKSLKDLRGKTFAFVDDSSTSGSIYPRLMLKNAGLDAKRDFRLAINAGSHDAVLLSVLHGKVDAGATYANDPQGRESAWSVMLKDPKQRAQVQVLAISAAIPSDNIAVRGDLDPRIVAQVRKAFLDLSATAAGRARIKEIYHVDGFTTAEPSDYAPVREAFEKIGIPVR